MIIQEYGFRGGRMKGIAGMNTMRMTSGAPPPRERRERRDDRDRDRDRDRRDRRSPDGRRDDRGRDSYRDRDRRRSNSRETKRLREV